MGKHKRARKSTELSKAGLTQADLVQAKWQTLMLGAAVVLGLALDGGCYGWATMHHERLFLPLPVVVFPIAALILFIISLISWRTVRRRVHGVGTNRDAHH